MVGRDEGKKSDEMAPQYNLEDDKDLHTYT